MEASTELYRGPDFSIDNGISWMTDGSVAIGFIERSSVNSLASLHSSITTECTDAGPTYSLYLCTYIASNRKECMVGKSNMFYIIWLLIHNGLSIVFFAISTSF